MEDGDTQVIGTAHVSDDSAQQVRNKIKNLDPDIVAVELDHNRYESVNSLRDKADVSYGVDMIAAIDEAKEQDIPVALIDRDIRVTIKRFWNKMTGLERIKTLGALLAGFLGLGGVDASEIDEILEDQKVQTYINELREFSPSGARVLIDERDAYMASKLHELNQRGDNVVAVVGAGHREGVKSYLDDPASIPDVTDVLETQKHETPEYDVCESKDEVIVQVDLPGVVSETLEVNYGASKLVIEGEVEKPFEPGYFYVEENRPREVETEIPLDYRLDGEEATAVYDNGVLEVRLPRS
ncbi:MAG: TraB/GumN family protein [Halobacteria archaeon]